MGNSIFFKNTAILMISNVISGVLAFVFTVILSQKIGAAGMGLYQLILPLFTMLIYLTGGGISIAMSRIAAEKKANGRMHELYATIKVVRNTELVWSVIIIALIALGVSFISTNILSDKRTYLGILAFCPALIMTSITAVYRGVYYGVQRVYEPAIIDILEKLFKIILMCFMIRITGRVALELAIAGAIFALSLGEASALIMFYLSFIGYKKKNPAKGLSDNKLQLAFDVYKVSIPVSLEGIITSLFSTLIVIMLPRRLQHAGIGYEDSLSLLGKLQGMALNIVYFPLMITNSFNMLLIPSIAESITKRNNILLNHRINTAVRVAAASSFLAAAIILCDPTKIGNYFYRDYIVGQLILCMAPMLPIIYIELISYSIINGLGLQGRVLINSMIIQILDLILLYIFVGIGYLNIFGYVLNTVISAGVGIILNYWLIAKETGLKLNWYYSIIVPFSCGIITYITASRLLFKYLELPYSMGAAIIFYIIIFQGTNRVMSGNYRSSI